MSTPIYPYTLIPLYDLAPCLAPYSAPYPAIFTPPLYPAWTRRLTPPPSPWAAPSPRHATDYDDRGLLFINVPFILLELSTLVFDLRFVKHEVREGAAQGETCVRGSGQGGDVYERERPKGRFAEEGWRQRACSFCPQIGGQNEVHIAIANPLVSSELAAVSPFPFDT